MTVRVSIDFYAGKTPFLNKMLHMADQKGNGNNMLDQDVEVSYFLKLANIEANKEKLKKYGLEVTDCGNNCFIIRKTKDDAESVLSYDLNENTLKQTISCKGASIMADYTGNNECKCAKYYKDNIIGTFKKIDKKVYNDEQTLEQGLSSPCIFSEGKYNKMLKRATDNQF